MTMLDPWNDAAIIATRLSGPAARLVVFIGAESWCERCRTLKPVFESAAQQREDLGETWIWLDLEEHAEFLGGFIPDDLPILMSYRGAHLAGVSAGRVVTVEAIAQGMSDSQVPETSALPDIRGRLLAADWAL